MKRTLYCIGNWKMNQRLSDIAAFFDAFTGASSTNVQVGIAPQAIHASKVRGHCKGSMVGAQTCSEHSDGAFTGETSATSLKDIGAHFVLIGHSERRELFGESSPELLGKKISAAKAAGLKVVFCLGEGKSDRENNRTFNVLSSQLQALKGQEYMDIIIAYEPVWAIGTGLTASPEQAQEAHAFIRSKLQELHGWPSDLISILYGGSVKPSNFKELLQCSDIDGALVGGASLKGESFQALCDIASEA